MLEEKEYEELLLEMLFEPGASRLKVYLIEGLITAGLTALLVFVVGIFVIGGIPCAELMQVSHAHEMILLGHQVAATCH